MRQTADRQTIDLIEATTGAAYKPVKGCGTIRGYNGGCQCYKCEKAAIEAKANRIVKAAMRHNMKPAEPINQPKEQTWNF